MKKIRTSLLVGVLGLATVAPLAVSATAEAATAVGGCSVNALKPEWRLLSDNSKQVRGVAQITCPAARYVTGQVGLRESDTFSDDFVMNSGWSGVYTLTGSMRLYSGWVACPNTEPGNEELFTAARIAASGSLGTFDLGKDAILPIAC